MWRKSRIQGDGENSWKAEAGICRKHIFFSGTVQGVGFRYRSWYLAQKLHLSGWVRNLWDGRVEMEVQGEEQQIEVLLEQLYVQPLIEITDIEQEVVPCIPEREFRIAN